MKTEVKLADIIANVTGGIAYIDRINNAAWDAFIDKRINSRWFWIGPRMFEDSEEVKQANLSIYNEIYMLTKQYEDYKYLIDLYKNKPDSIITIDIEELNAILSFKKVETT